MKAEEDLKVQLERIKNLEEEISNTKRKRESASIFYFKERKEIVQKLTTLNTEYSAIFEEALARYRKSVAEQVQMGNEITFGEYWVDKEKTKKKPIEWIVIDKKERKAFLLSKYVLDSRVFDDQDKKAKINPPPKNITIFDTSAFSAWLGTTWKECDLRNWLNSDFLNTAFASVEQELITTTKVVADKNPWFATDAGENTLDKVFVLSAKEVFRYFDTVSETRCLPTEYVEPIQTYRSQNGYCSWQLRTPGSEKCYVLYVDSEGTIDDHEGKVVSISSCGIRPAMWIEW